MDYRIAYGIGLATRFWMTRHGPHPAVPVFGLNPAITISSRSVKRA
jgi:hypothetical protein